ncbi:MAG: GNAT family N-acetyltransferase [Flavisolibacter sp.]
MVAVRIAEHQDTSDIINIYTPYVLRHATTFETQVPSLLEMENRVRHYLERYPWLVCTLNNMVIGYVYASAYKDREAYRWSCECSVYFLIAYQGKGLAKELYKVLFTILKVQGFRSVLAGITLPNPASIKLHEGFGFKCLAIYENIGYKLDSWKSVGWWRLQINEFSSQPAPPLFFCQMNPDRYTQIFQTAAQNIQQKLSL